MIENSSSSESDIENYLQKPEDLNLNSTFFKVGKSSEIPRTKSKYEQTSGALSDSDSDDPLSVYTKKDEHVASTSKYTEEPEEFHEVELENAEVFRDQNKHVLELEEAKKQVEAYISRRMVEKATNADEVNDLLAAGEKPFDLKEDLAEVGFHPSDFESDNASEKDDWEEVQETEEKNIVPKEGVEITVTLADKIKKKKGIDLMDAIKRRMNRFKKQQQVFLHEVHLLGWIAHGNYINNILNKENVMALALSLLPTKHSYPLNRIDLKYLERITKWYQKAIKYAPDPHENHVNIEKVLLKQISEKVATSSRILVYIFVSMLRALGVHCRIILSLQVEPLRPPASDLCSLKKETTPKKEIKKTDTIKRNELSKSKNEECACKSRNLSSIKTVKLQIKKSPDVKKASLNDENPKESSSKLDLSKLKSPPVKATVAQIKKSPALKPSDKKVTKENSKEAVLEKRSVRKESTTDNKKTIIAKKVTKPSSKKTTRSNTMEKKQDEATSSTHLVTAKPVRSKSASNMDKDKSKDNLQVPKATKTSRSKSASNETKKSNIVSRIDETVAVLETLENPKKNPQNSTEKLNSSTSDDDFLNLSSWRKLKSPVPNTEKKKIEPKIVNNPVSLNIRSSRSKQKLPEKNPALLDSIFLSDDEKVKAKNRNMIKVRAPVKTKHVPQVDGINDSTSDEEMVCQVDGADDKPSRPRLKALKMSSKSSSSDQSPSPKSINLSKLKSPMQSSGSSKLSSTSQTSSFFSPEKCNVKNDIVKLLKKGMREHGHKSNRSYKEDDSDSDFAPESSPKKRKAHPSGKVKKRVLPRSQLEALEREKAAQGKKKVRGTDIWVEVFLEEEEKWISVDVVSGKVHCIKDLHNKATHPISYILSWDNINKVKDVTKRYCSNWNTVTRKLRTDQTWLNAALKPFIGEKTARDKEEDDDLAKQQLDQPLPKTISEYKDHPLYVLTRHLLKFQAIYPADAPILGFIRNEAVYSRDCVYVLHSRDIWLKEAKVVKPGETPYKIVKARPKWDKLSNAMITDQLLEIFGVWQVQDYEPPTAENGVVPRNAYGNIELFKPCMLPKNCVHLQLPGLKKVAAKLKIDCAPALTGFDFHNGWNHAIYDGFVVCEEFKDILIAAWEQEQEEITKREQEKYEKRVYGNWRRLIKAALIRRRLKLRYDFTEEKPEMLDEEEPVEKIESPPKNKRPKFMKRK